MAVFRRLLVDLVLLPHYVIAQQSIKWYQMEWARPLRLYCRLGDTRFHKTSYCTIRIYPVDAYEGST
jgi:hypothetical protein